MTAVGQNIKKKREVAGKSIRQLAREVGLSHTQVADIEHGKKECSLSYIDRFAEALDVAPRDLMPQRSSESTKAGTSYTPT